MDKIHCGPTLRKWQRNTHGHRETLRTEPRLCDTQVVHVQSLLTSLMIEFFNSTEWIHSRYSFSPVDKKQLTFHLDSQDSMSHPYLLY